MKWFFFSLSNYFSALTQDHKKKKKKKKKNATIFPSQVKVDAARRAKKTASELKGESALEEKGQAPKEEEPLYCGYSPLPFKQHEKNLLRTEVRSLPPFLEGT